jgi:hypothetical protein
VEEGAGHQADHGRRQEHHHRPSGDLLRVGTAFQVQVGITCRIELQLEFLGSVFKLSQPGVVELLVEFLQEHGRKSSLELEFGPFELSYIELEGVLDLAAQSFHL